MNEKLLHRALADAAAHPLAPALSRQFPRRLHRLLQRLISRLILAEQVADAVFKAAHPAFAARIAAGDPAAELGRLKPRELCGEGAVRRIEEMMPLIKDKALGKVRIIGARGGVDHDKRMVGDDEVGFARFAR